MSGATIARITDLAEFRSAVRAWLRKAWLEIPAGSKPPVSEYENLQRWWFQELSRAGLATPHWPSKFGGSDLSIAHRIVVAEECAKASAPPLPMYVISLNHIPATLMHWGTEDQNSRYLPGICSGDVWCQGFSEPNAGSDLVSLRTRAERDGDHYILNGQKVWSSYSMYAKYCILLARTDRESRRHVGISYFILDMALPGVDVRPIRQATGKATFAEIFLTDVRIPISDLLGEEHKGWSVAQTTLSAERGVLSLEGVERIRWRMEAHLSESLKNAAGWLSDAQQAREFVDLFARMSSVRRSLRTLLSRDEASTDGMLPAMIKISATELLQAFSEFLVRTSGLGAVVSDGTSDRSLDEAGAMYDYIASFGGTIAAGTNEIMRNLIAERGMGLLR